MQMNIQDQYCFWDTRSLVDTIIIMMFIVIIFGLFWRVFYRLIKYQIIEHYNKKRLIYLNLLIIIWAIVSMARKIYGVMIYFTVLRNDQPHNMTSFSIEYTKFSTIAGFLVNSIFLQVFYLYYNGLLNWIEVSRLTPFQNRLILLFKIYYVLRVIMKLPLEVLIFVKANTSAFFIINSLNNVLLAIDGLITAVFLIISYQMFTKYFKAIRFSREQDKKKLKKQYMVIIIICFFRVIMNILFLKEVKDSIFNYEEGQCYSQNTSDHWIYTTIYVVLVNSFCHVFPIMWVIKIYDLKQSSILKVQKKIDQINNLQKQDPELLLSYQTVDILEV